MVPVVMVVLGKTTASKMMSIKVAVFVAAFLAVPVVRQKCS